jgi:hypothetical protein
MHRSTQMDSKEIETWRKVLGWQFGPRLRPSGQGSPGRRRSAHDMRETYGHPMLTPSGGVGSSTVELP